MNRFAQIDANLKALDCVHAAKPARPTLPEKPTEDEIADVVLYEIGSENLIGTHAGTMYWTCQHWKTLVAEQIRELVREILRDLALPVRRTLLVNITSLISDRVFDHDKIFNSSENHIVSVQNGDLLLIDGKWQLVPAQRDRLRTAVLPHMYDPKATAPRFMEFLDEIFEGDPDSHEKANLILQHVGYALQSHTDFERCSILVGSGANGKSVLLNTLKHLLGPANVAAVQPFKLNSTFHRATLNHKLANIITEGEQGGKLPAAEIKALVSGESMTVDHKFGQPFVMTPFASLFWATNHLPHPSDYSDAIYRRVDIIEFNRKFSEQERDVNLTRELKAEMPGILNAALDAYAGVVKTGFEAPMSVTTAKNKWRQNADPVACWADERLERSMIDQVQSQTAYTDFKIWSDENGYRLRLTQKTFSERLQHLGFQKSRTKNAKFWQDVRLVPGVPG